MNERHVLQTWVKSVLPVASQAWFPSLARIDYESGMMYNLWETILLKCSSSAASTFHAFVTSALAPDSYALQPRLLWSRGRASRVSAVRPLLVWEIGAPAGVHLPRIPMHCNHVSYDQVIAYSCSAHCGSPSMLIRGSGLKAFMMVSTCLGAAACLERWSSSLSYDNACRYIHWPNEWSNNL